MNHRLENKLQQLRQKMAKLETDAKELKTLREDYLYVKRFRSIIVWGCKTA